MKLFIHKLTMTVMQCHYDVLTKQDIIFFNSFPGVKLILTPVTSAMFARSGMLAPDGRCKTLATTANGYGRGEACATILLTEQTLESDTSGLLVFMGSAVNQDGRSSSLTAPNGPAQQRAIQAALLAGSVAAQVCTSKNLIFSFDYILNRIKRSIVNNTTQI